MHLHSVHVCMSVYDLWHCLHYILCNIPHHIFAEVFDFKIMQVKIVQDIL